MRGNGKCGAIKLGRSQSQTPMSHEFLTFRTIFLDSLSVITLIIPITALRLLLDLFKFLRPVLLAGGKKYIRANK